MNYYNSETLLEQQQEIEKLKEQNAALAATVEALRRELQACQNVLHSLAHDGQVTPAYANDAKKVLAATPQQHLAEIRAEAVERSLKTLSHRWKPDTYGDAAFIRVSELNQYADSIRKGGTK